MKLFLRKDTIEKNQLLFGKSSKVRGEGFLSESKLSETLFTESAQWVNSV